MAIRGQNIPHSSKPDVQLLDAKAYQTDLVNHELTYNHSDIHPKFSDAETPVSMGTLILSANEKTTPIDADMVSIMDTADSNKLKKLSWANVKVVLKAYFDTLYAAASTNSFPGFGTSGSTACVGNDARLSDSRTPAAHSHATSDVTEFATAALAAAPAETATTIGALINAATAITAPDDTDVIAMRNHTGGLLHKMTWAYVKSVLKTYFDGIYQATGSYLTSGGSLGTPSGGNLTNCTFPTLNQNTSGTAANVTTGSTSWTPTMLIGGTEVGGYVQQLGTYTKIGNIVTIMGRVRVNNLGSGTGNVSIGGLPFAVRTGVYGGVAFGYLTGLTGYTSESILGSLSSASSAIGMFSFNPAGGGVNPMTKSNVTTSVIIDFSGSYLTD